MTALLYVLVTQVSLYQAFTSLPTKPTTRDDQVTADQVVPICIRMMHDTCYSVELCPYHTAPNW